MRMELSNQRYRTENRVRFFDAMTSWSRDGFLGGGGASIAKARPHSALKGIAPGIYIVQEDFVRRSAVSLLLQSTGGGKTIPTAYPGTGTI